jgi:hypothetical protein
MYQGVWAIWGDFWVVWLRAEDENVQKNMKVATPAALCRSAGIQFQSQNRLKNMNFRRLASRTGAGGLLHTRAVNNWA